MTGIGKRLERLERGQGPADQDAGCLWLDAPPGWSPEKIAETNRVARRHNVLVRVRQPGADVHAEHARIIGGIVYTDV